LHSFYIQPYCRSFLKVNMYGYYRVSIANDCCSRISATQRMDDVSLELSKVNDVKLLSLPPLLQNKLVAQDTLQLGANGYTSLILPNANFSLVDKVRDRAA
jgi:hypothetical protein